jgi:hypothetical protein
MGGDNKIRYGGSHLKAKKASHLLIGKMALFSVERPVSSAEVSP